jgi:hypothetical protein
MYIHIYVSIIYIYVCISYSKIVIHIYTNIYVHIYLTFIGRMDISSTYYENEKKNLYTCIYIYMYPSYIYICISYSKTVIHIYTNINVHIYLTFIGRMDISSTHYENKKNCIYFESANPSYTVKYVFINVHIFKYLHIYISYRSYGYFQYLL